MKTYSSRAAAFAACAMLVLCAGGVKAAGVDVNINLPGVYTPPPAPVFVAPQPTYVQPQPVYVRTETRYVDCKNGKCKDKKYKKEKHHKHHKHHGRHKGHGDHD
ncbi:MAG: hypothetical protein V4695_10655 [Pseudomonadota bacterium]